MARRPATFSARQAGQLADGAFVALSDAESVLAGRCSICFSGTLCETFVDHICKSSNRRPVANAQRRTAYYS